MPCARETSLWHNSLLYDAGLDVFHGSVELIEKSFFFFVMSLKYWRISSRQAAMTLLSSTFSWECGIAMLINTLFSRG